MAREIEVAELTNIALGTARVVTVDDEQIALFNIDGTIYAIDDMCSHAEASLAEGDVEGHTVICPLHGAKFDLKTGQHLCLPAVTPVNSYKTKIVNEKVFLILDD